MSTNYKTFIMHLQVSSCRFLRVADNTQISESLQNGQFYVRYVENIRKIMQVIYS